MSPDVCLHQLFEAAARAHPDAVAVTAADGELTYAQLDARSARLAARLVEAGVGPDMIIGLYVERTTELVVGMLGILRAGGAYLPIDTTFPDDRVRWLIADSGAPVVVTGAQPAPALAGAATATIVTVDDEPHGGAPGHRRPAPRCASETSPT